MFIYLFGISISLVPPFWCLVLLIRSIANAIEDIAIKATVRNIRSYDSGEGNEVEMLLLVSDSINTWFACIYVPAITGPTEAPIR